MDNISKVSTVNLSIPATNEDYNQDAINDLTAIKNLLQDIKGTTNTDAQKQYLGQIEDLLNQMKSFINQVKFPKSDPYDTPSIYLANIQSVVESGLTSSIDQGDDVPGACDYTDGCVQAFLNQFSA